MHAGGVTLRGASRVRAAARGDRRRAGVIELGVTQLAVLRTRRPLPVPDVLRREDVARVPAKTSGAPGLVSLLLYDCGAASSSVYGCA